MAGETARVISRVDIHDGIFRRDRVRSGDRGGGKYPAVWSSPVAARTDCRREVPLRQVLITAGTRARRPYLADGRHGGRRRLLRLRGRRGRYRCRRDERMKYTRHAAHGTDE